MLAHIAFKHYTHTASFTYASEQLSETLSEVRARYKLLLAQTGLKNLNIFPVPVDYEVPREPRTSDSNEEVADSAVRVASHDRPTKVNIAAISF